VNCERCLNDRHNRENSLRVGYASFLLNGAELESTIDQIEKGNPVHKDFRKKNYSEGLMESLEKLCEISKITCKKKTAQARLNYVRSLPESPERYLIEATAHAWFTKLK